MKKFIALALAGAISLTNASLVMATSPAPVVPKVVSFPLVSFEEEVPTWTVEGGSFTQELTTTEGVVNGSKALKVALTARATDWNQRNNVSIIPPSQIWSIPAGKVMVASVTNPLDVPIQLRCNLKDAANNTRMTFWSIPAKTTREIVWGAEEFGTIGVANGKWKEDGFAQKGVDPTAISAITFYMAEPELEKVMPGLATPAYILDNITIKDAPAPVVPAK